VKLAFFLVESLQLGNVARLCLVNVSEILQFFLYLNGYGVLLCILLLLMKLLA
jgi:hypothetical protein